MKSGMKTKKIGYTPMSERPSILETLNLAHNVKKEGKGGVQEGKSISSLKDNS